MEQASFLSLKFAGLAKAAGKEPAGP